MNATGIEAHSFVEAIALTAMANEYKDVIKGLKFPPQLEKLIATVFKSGVEIGVSLAVLKIAEGASQKCAILN